MSGSVPSGPGWRADVRNTVAEILRLSIPDLGGRVFRARVLPVGSDAKPALLIYGYAEKKDLLNEGGWQHQFRVTSAMVVKVLTENADAEAAEAQCEGIAGQVERAILRSAKLFSPEDGKLERCTAVTTQITAEQKDRFAEAEATIEFQLVWAEVFTMAEPDTSECDEVTIGLSDPSIPNP
jgi:hypothetical protein